MGYLGLRVEGLGFRVEGRGVQKGGCAVWCCGERLCRVIIRRFYVVSQGFGGSGLRIHGFGCSQEVFFPNSISQYPFNRGMYCKSH